MRKNLLLIAALATTASAMAIAPNQQPAKLNPLPAKSSVTNPSAKRMQAKDLLKANVKSTSSRITKATRADETYNMQWGYCDEPWNAVQFDGYEVNQAIYVAPEFTEFLDGSTVKNILAGNPVDSRTFENPVKSCTVWIRESLDKDPVAEGTGEMGPDGFDWSTIELSKPYTIEKGKDFYVGVTYTLPSDNPYAYGYLTDYTWPEYDNTNLIYSSLNGYDEDGEPTFGEEKTWQNIAYDYGNACIRLDVYGDNLPQNIVSIYDYYAPSFVAPGDKVMVDLTVVNKGANPIEDIVVSLQYDGEEAQTVHSLIYSEYDEDWNLLPGAITYNKFGVAIAEFECPKTEGNFRYVIKIAKINGEADNNSDAEVSGYLLCLNDGFHKNVVVEEGTGLWCGYCPVGWAGMEYLRENFSEEGVIGVALHDGDIMDVLEEGAFSPFLQYYEGVPSCFYNRDFLYSDYPSPENFEMTIPELLEVPASASINAELKATEDKSVVTLSTKSEFLINGEEGEYEVGYTVVEDGVGPYLQTNYLSGEPDDESYGFGSKGERCPLKFNDVARNCSKPMGIEGSLPAVEKGKVYDYSCDVELSDVKNVDNCRIVAMIINKKTGFIENAAVVAYPSSDVSAVKAVADAGTASFARGVKGAILIDGDSSNVSIYSLSGVKVAKADGFRVSVPAGIYIVSRGTEAVKVVVK